MNKNKLLQSENIPQLLLKLTIPATIGMLVMALYNIVDTIFIGRYIGPKGIAGLSIVFPIQLIVMAFGQLVGMGGASIISRAFGAEDFEKANRTFGNQVISTFFFSALVIIPGVMFPQEILKLFGATDSILPYSLDYYRIVVFNAWLFMFAMMTNNVLRAEGRAKLAMTNMIISAVLNMILDAVFIAGLGMGIKGAALATVVAQGIVVLYFIYHFTFGQSYFKIRLKYLIPNFKLLREIYAIGLSAFFRQVSGSLIVVLINNKLASFDTQGIYIAVYGVINRLCSLFFMTMFGIAQGLQPVLGFNYGAKRLHLAKKSIRLAFTWATGVALVSFALIMIVPESLISMFTKDPEVIAKGTYAMRRINLLFPLLGFQIIGAVIFQSLGKATESLILAMSRQVIFFLPALYILSYYFRFDGVWYAFPAADMISVLVTLFFVKKELNSWKKFQVN